MDIIGSAKNAIHYAVQCLNQPLVKEGVKNVAGTITLAFGLVELYDVSQILRGREISTESRSNLPKWQQTANTVTIVCAKVSLVLSAAVSRPGVFLISTLIGCVFTTVQLEYVFGPNTIFAINPWHPRHVVSIVAVILALPAVAKSAYKGAVWTYKKVYQHTPSQSDKSCNTWLTDSKLRVMILFNTITSRPVLHIGNQLGRLLS